MYGHSITCVFASQEQWRGNLTMFFQKLMLDTAQALLRHKGLCYREHAAYGQYFAKPAVLAPEFQRWLLAAFNRRGRRECKAEAQNQDVPP